MLAHLHRLLAHLRWADERVLDALRSAAPAPPATALELYAHVLGAEHVWLARIEQRRAELPVWPALGLAECERLGEENHTALERCIAELAPGDLDREVPYVNSAGEHFRSRVGDILLHTALHGSYHRGQIALLLRQASVVPLATDYIAFVRGAPAARRDGGGGA